jgi:hypothetical protein
MTSAPTLEQHLQIATISTLLSFRWTTPLKQNFGKVTNPTFLEHFVTKAILMPYMTYFKKKNFPSQKRHVFNL